MEPIKKAVITAKSPHPPRNDGGAFIRRGRIVFRTVLLFATLSGFMISCDSGTETTDTNSALLEFAFSDCKDGVEEPDKAVPEYMALYTMSDSLNLEGLECVSWQHDGVDKLDVDLINFTNGCLPEWTGDASVTDAGAVLLTVENPICGMGGCGSCIYDWSFEVKGAATDADLDLSIEVWSYPQEGCGMDSPEEAMTPYALQIPKSDLSEGIVCRYVNPMDLEWLSKTGEIFLPCVDGECGPNLECVPHPQADAYENDTLCLLPCTEDTDCPNPALHTCDTGGHCILAAVWSP